MNRITQQLVIEALRRRGTGEVGGNNRGPQVEEWLARVHALPGQPWCVAYAWSMLDDACRALGVANPLRPVAGAHRLLELAKELGCWAPYPGEGYLFGIDHGHGLGHAGIVTGVRADLILIRTVEGNTNAAGGRDGKWVAEHDRQASEATLGYLDPGLLLAHAA